MAEQIEDDGVDWDRVDEVALALMQLTTYPLTRASLVIPVLGGAKSVRITPLLGIGPPIRGSRQRPPRWSLPPPGVAEKGGHRGSGYDLHDRTIGTGIGVRGA
jgi:hypothetical protein